MKIFGNKTKERLVRKFDQDGIVYSYEGDLSPSFPINSNSSEMLTELMIQGDLWSSLDQLWAGGLVEEIDRNTWRVPYSVYDTVEDLDDEQFLEMLLLPKPKNLIIETKSSSNVGQTDFKINIEATHPEHGPLREKDPKRSDRVFFLSEDCIVPLTRSQADVFNAARGTETDWDNLEDRMAYLAKTKNLALQVGARIDGYLKSEDYEFRENAKLDIEENSSEEFQIIPKIEGLESYTPNGIELTGDKVKGVISKPAQGFQRKRMVISKPLKERLEKLPKNGLVKGSEVPKLLTQPELVLPEGFDLSLFSERVKGIKTKVYNSRPYIHVGKNKGGWFEGIPGVELEDWSPTTMADGQSEAPDGQPLLSEETYRELAERAKETGSDYVLHEGNWIRIDTEQAEKFDEVVENYERDKGILKIPAGSILEIYENLELLEFIDRELLSKKDEQLPDDLPQILPPQSFMGQLFPYQLSGYQWLRRIFEHNLGGLLADDMGLGKTIQIIAHFLKLKEEGLMGQHLVIVPKTLLENWEREIQHFSNGKLACYSYGGSQRCLAENLLGQFDIVLTTYETLRRDQAMLGTINWNMVVCDEAQYAKNPTTQRTCALKALKSKHRAALTGTPVENGLIEFWCIMDFVQPGLLGSWADFRKEFERPIIESDDEERNATINTLLNKIKGYYLRRLKDQVLDLPNKITHELETCLSDEQFKMYQAIAREAKAGGKGAKLGAITKLLRLCAHPSTAKGFMAEPGKEWQDVPKLSKTFEILTNIKQLDEKAIIFTDHKIVQRALQDAIRNKFGIWPDIINGEITSNRQQIIDLFSKKDGFNVIILGHQVAGVGLNITSANHVIHYTRPWNPAKENQATDRAHRIGQEKSVNVYYPIVKDDRFKTVEERLDELIQSKSELARDVLRPTKDMQVKAEELFDCIDAVD